MAETEPFRKTVATARRPSGPEIDEFLGRALIAAEELKDAQASVRHFQKQLVEDVSDLRTRGAKWEDVSYAINRNRPWLQGVVRHTKW